MMTERERSDDEELEALIPDEMAQAGAEVLRILDNGNADGLTCLWAREVFIRMAMASPESCLRIVARVL
jgi:hypothetical protein